MKKRIMLFCLALLAYCLLGAVVSYHESAVQVLASLGMLAGMLAGKVSAL